MSNFNIVPLSAAVADKIRETRTDNFGNSVKELLATGYGPCRVSLKPFKVGTDKRLLFSYSPFSITNAFNQCGPIFINADPVEAYADTGRFPPGIKADKANFPLSLIGYNTRQEMVHTCMVGNADVDQLITDIFNQKPDVAYLHARNSEAQCFICLIERK